MLKLNLTQLTGILILLFVKCLSAQDALIGAGFGTNDWTTFDAFSPSINGSMILSSPANGTGNVYFRLASSGNQLSPSPTCSPGDDVLLTENITFIAQSSSCTNGAWYINSLNTTDQYIFKTPNTFDNRCALFRISGTIEQVSSVSQSLTTIYPKQAQTITAEISGGVALPTGQGVYLRYTTDNFATSTILEMTYSGSGGTYTQQIPDYDNTAGNTIQYYILTSGDNLSIAHADADWYSININNNAGSNYSYTVETEWTTNPGGDGTWDDPAMWDAGVIPPPGVPILVEDDIIVDMHIEVANITIDPAVTFTASDGTARQIQILDNGFIQNNGTFLSSFERLICSGDAVLTNIAQVYSIESYGGLNPGISCALTDSLIIQPGGFITSNPFLFTSTSTLAFNTGGNFDLFPSNLEWNASITPAHVAVLGGTSLVLMDDIDRSMTGNLSIIGSASSLTWNHNTFLPTDANLTVQGEVLISNGGHFIISDGDDHNLTSYDVFFESNLTIDASSLLLMNQDIGDDLFIAGNILNNGTLNSNNRLIVLNGTSDQSLTGIFTGDSRFHYIEVNNPGSIFLQNDIYVEDELRLTQGHTIVGVNQLIFGDTAKCLGNFSSSNMIIADDAGHVVKLFTEVDSFFFPIGDRNGTAEYSPLSLHITAGTFGPAAQVSINLIDVKHPNNPSITDFTTRYWTVEELDITSFSYDLFCDYVDSDIQGNESNFAAIKSDDNGASWQILGNVDMPSNRLDYVGMTSFSIFTAGSAIDLPIDLISFEAEKVDQDIQIQWETAYQETDGYIDLLHSEDGLQWDIIATLNCEENQQIYQYIHTDPAFGNHYYRLKMVDLEGHTDYSSIRHVCIDKTNARQVYVDQNQVIHIKSASTFKEHLVVELFHLNGQKIDEICIKKSNSNHHQISLTKRELPKVIIARLTFDQHLSSTHKLIISE